MSKSILITGSSSGFGKLIAETLAKDGHTVFASMRNVNGKNAETASALSDWSKKKGLSLNVVELDVTEDASINKAIQYIISANGKIDVVINNAGILSVGLNETLSTENVKHLFDVNVFGAFRVTKAALPFMRKQGSGLFIHISSINGRSIVPFTGVYCATKYALEALAESFRYDLATQGIDSVIVEPGAFPTEMGSNIVPGDEADILLEYGEMQQYLEQFTTGFEKLFSGPNIPNPQDVANAVKKLIDTPTGQRPLRTVVDQNKEGIEAINTVSREVQNQLLEIFGMKKLLTPKGQ